MMSSRRRFNQMSVTRTYKRESIPAAIDKGILKVARKYCEESFSDFNQLIDNALAVYLQLVDADTSISGWEELYYNLPTFAKGRKLQLMIEREIFDRSSERQTPER